jgi:hypothetical protein
MSRQRKSAREAPTVGEIAICHGHRIPRLLNDPDEYLVMLDFASAGGAEGFRWDPSLRRAIDAAGVEGGAHHVSYTLEQGEEIEASTYEL